VFGACYLARAIGQPSSTDARHDTITDVWHGQAAPPADPARAVGRPTCTADREGDGHPRGRRAAPKPTVRTKKTLWLWGRAKVSPTWSGGGAPTCVAWTASTPPVDQVHPRVDDAVAVQT
jgi:hypothetical protein